MSSATSSTSSTPSPNLQDQQILSEAQEDVSVANTIIAWSGFFIAFLATAVTIAGFFGIREFRRIQQLRTDFETHFQAVTTLKEQVEADLKQLNKRFENESQTFMEASYNFGIARDAYKIGDDVRAVEYYLRVLQLQPKNTQVMERLGRAYSNLNHIQKAIGHLEKALEIDSSYVPALRSLALCYRYTDKEKAIEYLERALDRDPSDYEAWDFLGLIYRDNGRIDDAIAAHERALATKKRPETQFYLSILYAMKGDKRRAKLMSLNAEDDLHKKEYDEQIRHVWKILIQSGVPIIEGNEDEAFQIIQTSTPYITTQRIYHELIGHLNFFLEATGHRDWIPKFTNILKVREIQKEM